MCEVVVLCADSRFAKPQNSLQRERFLVLFAACKKYRKNTLRRAKSCQWQVFVRRRPPKQGELRTDVSETTMFQGDRGLRTSGLRGRFKALSKKISAKLSGGTCRTRLFAQNSGVKALNRCEVRALQRKELERTSKEQPCSLRTVGYGWVGICGVCGGKGLLLRVIWNGLYRQKAFCLWKRRF